MQCASFCPRFLCFSRASLRLPGPRWVPRPGSCEFIGCNLPLLLSSLNIHKTPPHCNTHCVSPLFALFPVQSTDGALRSLARSCEYSLLPFTPRKWCYQVREAIVYQIGCFFTHCVKGGEGVKPMCKNLCCRFVSFWRPPFKSPPEISAT